MEHQTRLTPQVREYQLFMAGEAESPEEIVINWVPYVMFYNLGGYRSSVLNTDKSGFRYSHSPRGRHSLAEDRPEGPLSVVLGGSPAFGFGATTDAWTIPSRLA